jgi:hypothetical protein
MFFVSYDLHEGHLEVDKRQEHEYEKDSAGEQQPRLRLVLVVNLGDAGKAGPLLLLCFGQNEQQPTEHGDVS